jgi:hypothetical protein
MRSLLTALFSSRYNKVYLGCVIGLPSELRHNTVALLRQRSGIAASQRLMYGAPESGCARLPAWLV